MVRLKLVSLLKYLNYGIVVVKSFKTLKKNYKRWKTKK